MHNKMPRITSEATTAIKKKEDKPRIFQHANSIDWMWEGGIQWIKHLIQEASSTQIADKVDKFHSPFWGKYYISWCFTDDEKSY